MRNLLPGRCNTNLLAVAIDEWLEGGCAGGVEFDTAEAHSIWVAFEFRQHHFVPVRGHLAADSYRIKPRTNVAVLRQDTFNRIGSYTDWAYSLNGQCTRYERIQPSKKKAKKKLKRLAEKPENFNYYRDGKITGRVLERYRLRRSVVPFGHPLYRAPEDLLDQRVLYVHTAVSAVEHPRVPSQGKDRYLIPLRERT